MKKIVKLLVIFMISGMISCGENNSEAVEIENNKIIKKVFSEIEKYDAEEIENVKILEKIVVLLKSEIKKDNTGAAAGMLGMIYGGVFLNLLMN